MNKFEYKHITPFKWYVIQNFPFIEADFDAITNYQLYCKVVEYLNKVIEDTNTLGTQVENLTNAYNNLQDYVNNYFENLDIQDEINNKLDEIKDSGYFNELIQENYSNLKIINVLDYGATGDGVTNDTTAIQNAINNSNNKMIYFPSGTYIVDNLIFPNTGVIYGNGLKSIIKQSANSNVTNFIELQNSVTMKDLTIYGNSTGESITQAYSNATNGIYISGHSNTYLNNLLVRYFKGNGCLINDSFLVPRINECIFGNNDASGININGHDGIITNCQAFANRLNGFSINGTAHKLYGCYSYLNGCAYNAASPSARNGFGISAKRCSLFNCISEENFGNGYNIQASEVKIIGSLSTGNNVPYYDGAFKTQNRTIGMIYENTKRNYDFQIGANNCIIEKCNCYNEFSNKYGDYSPYAPINLTTSSITNVKCDINSDYDYPVIAGYNVLNKNFDEKSVIKINGSSILTYNHTFDDTFTPTVTNINSHSQETIIKSRDNKVFMQLNISFDDDIPVITKTKIADLKKLKPASSVFGVVYANTNTNYNQALYGYCEINSIGELSVFNYFNNLKNLTLVIEYEL